MQEFGDTSPVSRRLGEVSITCLNGPVSMETCQHAQHGRVNVAQRYSKLTERGNETKHESTRQSGSRAWFHQRTSRGWESAKRVSLQIFENYNPNLHRPGILQPSPLPSALFWSWGVDRKRKTLRSFITNLPTLKSRDNGLNEMNEMNKSRNQI